ncbi:hypothetical protein KEM64_15135 [Bacillus velezensis]|uniref:YopX family protein n=1 Tax=Bacillus velezensis TaxID=492670 RepID=UPI001BAAA9BC|nr:YopX family protein [Bacillus velezensis]QUS12835.1 hypothetical protein KEM64_15135 [Bacillus velezensis]WFO92081.1 hypothetical protein JEQ23_04935 [Bacillus velezensis]WFO92120.1 hypothetical protein JEQ23_05220 [Bacillus velezensis]WFO96170.1 hypothetical protein JEQ24_04925 [Bacillus velezensis]WGK54120.1 YopX family protein [Bacillus velezensis]
MNNIKIRYTFRHKETGNVELKTYFISQLEERPARKLSPVFCEEFGYELISRDLWTGKKLMEKEIYAGDIICYKSHGRVSNLVVKWSEDDAGFYAGGIRWDFVQMYGELIGNVHQNPEMLGGAAK